MEGRFLGSCSRQFRVSSAACNDALEEYWSSIRGSIMVLSFLLWGRRGFAHSIKLCWPMGRLVSSARKPVSISRSTTPKPYTSLFTYKWPVNNGGLCDLTYNITHKFLLFFPLGVGRWEFVMFCSFAGDMLIVCRKCYAVRTLDEAFWKISFSLH